MRFDDLEVLTTTTVANLEELLFRPNAALLMAATALMEELLVEGLLLFSLLLFVLVTDAVKLLLGLGLPVLTFCFLRGCSYGDRGDGCLFGDEEVEFQGHGGAKGGFLGAEAAFLVGLWL